MKMICCDKCGAPIISDETFLQNILDAMDDANRRAKHARTYSQRCVYIQEAAQYAKIFKAFMHNLTRRQEAENQNKAVLSALREHVISNGMMTQEQMNIVYEKGMRKARAKETECQKELDRIYGEFETICNRSMSSPTERDAFKSIP